VATDHEGFIAACERELASDTPAARARRVAAMREETWEKKVERLGDHVLRVSQRRVP
jgi:hypothetical protein